MEIEQGAAHNVHESVLNLMVSKDKGKVLDIAAGAGNISYNLYQMGFEVVAADINSNNFRPSDIEFHTVDANKKLNFDSNTFDYVISVETIEHLKNPWQFIDELHRILKPKGKLILTTPNTETIQGRLIFLLTGRIKWFLNDDIRESGHITPIFSWMFDEMIENKFVIKNVVYNDGEMLGILPRFGIHLRSINLRNSLFGEIWIFELEKL